jgi:hypothetical protein
MEVKRMSSQYKEIDVNLLQINMLNPRFEPQNDELTEMQLLINEGKLLALIKDIAQYGIDPSDIPIVTFDSEKKLYIAEEGNRRILAIKILNDPEIIPVSLKNRKSFIESVNNVKKEFSIDKINSITCVLINNEKVRRHFIELKHTGENEGAGRINWDTESKYRFDSNPFKSYLIDILTEMFPDNKEPFNLSTIDQRILTDPDMRSAMGMTVDRHIPSISFSSEEGLNRFRFIVQGLISKKFNVGDFYYKQNRIDFINKYFNDTKSSDDMDISIENDQPEEFEETNEPSVIIEVSKTSEIKTKTTKYDSDPNDSNDEESTKLNTKKQASPTSRNYPFQGINYNGSHSGIARSLYELHRISIKSFSLASTMLMRTFLECTLQEYILCKNLNLKIPDNQNIKSLSIQNLLNVCVNRGNQNFKLLKDSNSVVARIIDEANSKRDYDELNIVTHGNYREPSEYALWDIERRWYSAVEIMIREISVEN